MFCVTKTLLYNFDPFKPHFYIEKPGFTGVYIILFIPAQKHRLWVPVRTTLPRRFHRVPTIYVLSRNMKNIRVFFFFFLFFFFYLEIGKIFSIFEQACFRNGERVLLFLDIFYAIFHRFGIDRCIYVHRILQYSGAERL